MGIADFVARAGLAGRPVGVVAQPCVGPEIEVLPTVKQPDDSGCCGQHIVCEKTALLAGLSKDIVYFDDEELDRFAGVPADAYLPADEDEFREVFYTMRPGEVVEWVRSLELRHIEIPNGIKDEIFMMIRQ